jgi:hypothetical protein
MPSFSTIHRRPSSTIAGLYVRERAFPKAYGAMQAHLRAERTLCRKNQINYAANGKCGCGWGRIKQRQTKLLDAREET